MRKSKKFISLPIISLEEGQKIGLIKEIIIDPNRKEVAAILVEQRGWFKEQKIIPYNKVRSAGADAITIEKSSSVDKAANFPEIMTFLKEKITLIDARVITETGATLGQVDEFWVDELSGKIVALEISGKMFDSILKGSAQLPVEYIRTVGKDVLVAAENAEQHLVNVEGGLQDKLKTIKDVTGQLFTNTWQKTRELSKHVTIEKDKASAVPSTGSTVDDKVIETLAPVEVKEAPEPEGTDAEEPTIDEVSTSPEETLDSIEVSTTSEEPKEQQ